MRLTFENPGRRDVTTDRLPRPILRIVARSSALIAVVLLAVGLGGSAIARADAADPSIGLSIRASDPLAPVAVITNRGVSACRVADTAVGVISVAGIRQGGEAITPLLFTPGFDEPVDAVVASRLRPLAPGASVELPLNVVAVGPTGHAVEVITWSRATGPVGFLYPVRSDGALEIDASVSWVGDPVESGEVALCGPAHVATVAAGAAKSSDSGRGSSSHSGVVWIVVAAAVLVGSLIAFLVVRRRRSAQVVGVVILILAAGLVWQSWHAPAARATITADPSLQSALDGCLAVFAAHDPAGILPALQAPGVTVMITPGVNHEGSAGGTIFVYWDPTDRHVYDGTGGAADPCTSLYHEFFHAFQDTRGEQNPFECTTAAGHSGLGTNEVLATRAQNELRRELGLPERSHYGHTPLPSGDCQPRRPTDRFCTETGCSCRTPGCAESVAEPHLVTFDGQRYDFQGVGEFVAASDPQGGFDVQVRQQAFPGSDLVAMNTAIALDVAGTRVEVRAGGVLPVVLVDGTTRTHGGSLPNGGSLTVDSGATADVAVVWPDGSTAVISMFATGGLNLHVRPDPGRAARLVGLLGNVDGDPTNDVRTRGGAAIATPSFETLYPGFADSWRVDATSSLFTYDSGDGPDTFTDRSFPKRATVAADIADRAGAEALCRQFGVVDPDVLENCILDVGLTGRPEFAAAEAASQGLLLELGGPAQTLPATADIYAAGLGPLPPDNSMGSAPLRVPLTEADDVIVFPEISGEIGPAGAVEHGADGGDTSFARTDITAFNGLPAVRHDSRTLFVVGVFVPPGRGSTAVIDMSKADTDGQIAPALGEIFYVGDGMTASGAQQRFVVPAGAGALYLGFADAPNFIGAPGAYDDNVGAISITVAAG